MDKAFSGKPINYKKNIQSKTMTKNAFQHVVVLSYKYLNEVVGNQVNVGSYNYGENEHYKFHIHS